MTQNAVAAAEILPPTGHNSGIAAYNEFRAQLVELTAHNAAMVFQYATPKGNEAARSHIFKLRKTRAAVDKKRKEEKAESLEYGRRVDAEAKEISEQIDAMIDVHQKHLDEIEAREKARVDAIQVRIEAMHAQGVDLAMLSVEDIDLRRAVLESVPIDVSFAELMAVAIQVRDTALAELDKARVLAVEYERRTAELAEQRAREQKEREERIAAEAASAARAAAEKKAADDAATLALATKKAAEQAERQVKEAQDAALRAQQESEARIAAAVRADTERREREAAQAAAVEAARARDKARQAAVHSAVIEVLVAHAGLEQSQARAVVTVVYKGITTAPDGSGLKLVY